MAKLYIPLGIPGCGKSTFAHEVLAHSNLRIRSSDAIRKELFGDENTQAHNDEVFAAFHARIEHDLLNDLDVYADATNLQPFARATLRAIAERAEATTHLLWFLNNDQAVARNANRSRTVPSDAMLRLTLQYEKAARAVWDERYDTVTRIEGTG